MVKKILNLVKEYWFCIILCIIFVVGISYRLEAYFLERQLWFDEAQLAANFIEHSGFLWVFEPLDYLQIAPPFFLLGVKIFTVLFGLNEAVLRFIPICSGILSVFVFYFLSGKFLDTKRAIIFANFLFAINYLLVLYSTDFKQYGLDILLFMLVLMYCAKLKYIKDFTVFEFLKCTLIFSVLFFVSQPVIFILFGLCVFNILKYPKCLKIYLLPLFPLVCALLYKFSMPQDFNSYMWAYWEKDFISFSNMSYIIKGNIFFFTNEGRYLKPLIPFVFIGFMIFTLKCFKKDKARKKGNISAPSFLAGFYKDINGFKCKIYKLFLFSFLGLLLASIFRIYPVTGRVVVFLVPFFIIFISKCLDFEISNKCCSKISINKCVTFSVVAFVLLFCILFQSKSICKNRIEKISNISLAKDITLILKENFNKKDDILILPSASESLFVYYSTLLDFKISENKILKMNFYKNKDFIKDLRNIKNGKNYWVYLPYKLSFSRKITNWLDMVEQKSFYKIKLGPNSYLYKICF